MLQAILLMIIHLQFIKRLREKLEDNAQEPVIIKTVRGLGYKVGG